MDTGQKSWEVQRRKKKNNQYFLKRGDYMAAQGRLLPSHPADTGPTEDTAAPGEHSPRRLPSARATLKPPPLSPAQTSRVLFGRTITP